MFVMRIGRELQLFVVTGIVISEDQLAILINVLIGIHEAIRLILGIHIFPEVKH